jgi:hypothetical protein
MLTLRPTALSSPAYRHWLDYIVVEDGRAIGRMYEDRHAKAELRWFWSITVYVDPMRGIITSGRAATLEEAKTQFRASWQMCNSASAGLSLASEPESSRSSGLIAFLGAEAHGDRLEVEASEDQKDYECIAEWPAPSRPKPRPKQPDPGRAALLALSQ